MRKMKDSRIEWIGQIPEDKNIIRNKYLLKYIKGTIPSGTNTNQVGIPYIGASDLENIYGDANYSTYTTDYSVPQCEKKDILILWDGARAGLIGKNHEGAISSTIVKIASCPTISSQFLYWYLKGFEKYLYDCVNGTTIPHMNKTYIENLQMITWSKEEQSRIADFLDDKCGKIDRYIEKQRQIIEKLKAYKQSVITEAVTKGLDPTVPMKDSGVEWIGMIPAHWTLSKMKYLGKFVNGYAFPSEAFQSFGIRVLKIANIQPMKISWDDESFVDEEYLKLSDYFVENGDLVFALTRPIINGGIKTAIADFTETVLLNQRNAMFKGGKGITKEWQFFLMQNSMFIQEFAKYIDGTGQQPNISTKEISGITITLPPVAEQEKIVHYLLEKCENIDYNINKKQAIITDFLQYKKSLIYEAVTGKLEV